MIVSGTSACLSYYSKKVKDSGLKSREKLVNLLATSNYKVNKLKNHLIKFFNVNKLYASENFAQKMSESVEQQIRESLGSENAQLGEETLYVDSQSEDRNLLNESQRYFQNNPKLLT